MPPTIVAGTDGSSASDAAVLWAAERAQSLGAVLVIAHVHENEWTAGIPVDDQNDTVLINASALAASSFPGITVRLVEARGNPTIELLRLAEAAEMLVVGTHKTGFVQGRVFGSRGIRLAGSSSTAVAVVPERSPQRRRGVVVGIDDSEAGREAIRFGAEEAGRTGEDLLLLLGTVDAPVERELELSALALRIVEDVSADIGVRIRVMHRQPARVLVDVARSARLLVIGSSRHHVDGSTALGPVAHDVLFNIPTATIVVHPPVGSGVAVGS